MRYATNNRYDRSSTDPKVATVGILCAAKTAAGNRLSERVVAAVGDAITVESDSTLARQVVRTTVESCRAAP